MVHENQPSATALMTKALHPQVRRLIPIATALLLALLASQALSLLNPLVARAYSCGNPSSGHCYGYNYWSMPSGTKGAGTDIVVVHLNCSSCWSLGETGFIDNEMWFSNYNNSGCSNLGNACWVEAGYETVSGAFSTTVNYFWADNRPGHGFSAHVLAQVPSGDYGNSAEFSIWQTGSGTWAVNITSPNYNYSNSSTSNSMVPNAILIGQELAGTSGASAPIAYFTNNWYYDSNWNFYYQGYEGGVTSQNPPSAWWDTDPHNSSSGGVFQTSCC